jgi:hypothetical protein
VFNQLSEAERLVLQVQADYQRRGLDPEQVGGDVWRVYRKFAECAKDEEGAIVYLALLYFITRLANCSLQIIASMLELPRKS